VLFFIEPSARRVEIAGITAEPDACWMNQVSRNVTDASDGFLTGKRYLIHDRDPLFTSAFRETLASAGVETVKLPPRSPNLNAYAERFVRSVKESCLDRLILVGEGSLRRSVREFVEHYHVERNHQRIRVKSEWSGFSSQLASSGASADGTIKIASRRLRAKRSPIAASSGGAGV
jgi:putative transposase